MDPCSTPFDTHLQLQASTSALQLQTQMKKMDCYAPAVIHLVDQVLIVMYPYNVDRRDKKKKTNFQLFGQSAKWAMRLMF